MRLRPILTICLSVAWAPVAPAQTKLRDKPPANINDCTLVRDPTILRDCLDLNKGQRLGPTIDRSPTDPIVSPQLLQQAKPEPRNRRSDGSAAARPALRPAGFDPVRVEQVRQRRRSERRQ